MLLGHLPHVGLDPLVRLLVAAHMLDADLGLRVDLLVLAVWVLTVWVLHYLNLWAWDLSLGGRHLLIGPHEMNFLVL